MKALLTLKSAINQSSVIGFITLVTLVPVIYPETSLAANSLQTQGEKSLVFQIKDPNLIQQNQNLSALSYAALANQDPLVIKLRDYLEQHNSPLAEYAAEMVQNPNWEKALAISNVESNMGIHCYDNNCSGIGVKPGHPSWRKYSTKLEWFRDLCELLEQPLYKDRFNTFEKMRGVYVQPGSASWVYGAKKTYAELMILEKDAEEQRIAQSQNAGLQQVSQITFPELAMLTK